MKRLLQIVYSIYAMLWFFLLMLLVLLLVPVCLLLGKVRGGNLVYTACNYWARLWYGLTGIRHKEVYEVPHNRTRQYIFVVNHTAYTDIPAIVRCMHQPVRVLGKQEMVRYPLFGLIYRLAVIVVNRTSAENRARSVRALKAALKRGISIVIFPEGTFNETGAPLKDFYDGAFRIAIETQTPIKPILLPDGTRRMHYSGLFTLTPGPNRAVFMDEISVAGLTLADTKPLKEKVFGLMKAGLLRYTQPYAKAGS